MPWESVTDDGVVLALKSDPTKMRSPAKVFAGKERVKELVLPEVVLAASCTKEEVELTVKITV